MQPESHPGSPPSSDALGRADAPSPAGEVADQPPLPGSPNAPDTDVSSIATEATSLGETSKQVSSDGELSSDRISTDRQGTAGEDTLIMLRDAPEIPGYQLLDVLGRGGMGIVYLAEQMNPRRFVALKTIIAGPLANKSLIARFRREVEAVGRVPHPNIVTLFEIGECKGHPFYTMEYLGGGTLADRIHQRRFSGDEAAELLIKLARAVHSAHQFGFVHRDLKPSNILFTADGTPKIADFGLVKWLTDAQEESPATRTGEVMGTLSYMSPEQASGNSKNVDATSDVYSLGIMLYEMVTGRCPFVGDNLITQILTAEVPSPAWLAPGISRDLERICLRALRKNPRERYQSAEEFAQDLERYLAREPIDKPSLWYRVRSGVRRQWKLHRRRMLAVATAVAVIAATATWAVTGYLYRWECVRYFHEFDLRWLQVVGRMEVSESDIARRFQTFEIVSRGRLGRVERVTVIGSDGRPNSLNMIEPFLFDIREALPTQSKEVSYTIKYDDLGRFQEQVAFDTGGDVVWRFVASYPQEGSLERSRTVLARYLDAEGNDLETTTGASRIRISLREDGWVDRVEFLSGKGTPAASTQGYFGIRYEYDSRHRPVRQIFLDADGEPTLSTDGIAGIDMSYDARGLLVKSTCFDVEGEPAATGFGQAQVLSTYDDVGNLVELASQGLDGSPAPLGNRGSMPDWTREVYGYEDGQWLTYIGYTAENEVAAEAEFAYDAEGGRILRTVKLYSAPGIVSGVTESVLDPDFHSLEECTWTGSPETGTIPECIVYTRDEFGRVLTESYYSGRPQASAEPAAPWQLIEYEYEFGRLAAQTTTTRGASAGGELDDEIVHTVFEYDDSGRLAASRSYQGAEPQSQALFKFVEFHYDRLTGRATHEDYFTDDTKTAPYHDPDEHWSRIDYEYDEFGHRTRKVFTGFPEDFSFGRMVYDFDALERVVGQSYWRDAAADDAENELTAGPARWGSCEMAFNDFGMHAREEYTACTSAPGVYREVVEFRYNLSRQLHTYWTEDNQRAYFDGNHSWMITQRPDGTRLECIYSDFSDGTPYAAIFETYDEDEHVIAKRWEDADGHLARNEFGYSELNMAYWPNGNDRRREIRGYDVDVVGYPVLVTLYDEDGRIMEERAEDDQGNLVVPPALWALDEYVYENGRRTEKRMSGFDESVFGISRKTEHYDSRERAILIECFDDAGNIHPSIVDLFGRQEITYDDDADILRQVSTALLPELGADGWMIVRTDAFQILSEEFHDAEGQLVDSAFGYARAEYDYSDEIPTSHLYNAAGMEVTCESRVDDVFPGSIAEQKGLQPGDVIVSYDGVPITSRMLFVQVQNDRAEKTGDVIFVVRRDGEEIEIPVPAGKLGFTLWDNPVDGS